MSAKPHRHRRVSDKERAFAGPIPGAKPNPSAHGWVVVIEKCVCGAERRTNRNGYHTERGPWNEPDDFNPNF